MKDALPGAIEPSSGLPYLFGGDRLARDVFSRVVAGSRVVLVVAPLATLLALSLGITLGLPAGYFGRRVDAFLSFLANLVLSFPIILLFYLLVSPGILEMPIPYALAGDLLHPFRSSLFSALFFRLRTRPDASLAHRPDLSLIGGWIFAGLRLRFRSVRHRLDRAVRDSTFSSRSRSPRVPAVPDRAKSYVGHQDARIRARRRKRAASCPGTSCCGRSCPTRAGR